MNSPGSETLDLPAGSTLPRIYTPPLVSGDPGPCECQEWADERHTDACICRCFRDECGCALTPETSFGFNVIDFAHNLLRFPPDPWQRWLLIHGCEIGPNGRPRFRKILVLVARQNGKTQLLVILSLYWLFIQQVSLVLGISSKVEYAKEAWAKAKNLAQRNRIMRPRIPKKGGVRLENGNVTLMIRHPVLDDDGFPVIIDDEEIFDECRYKIAAANDDAGRSTTTDRLIIDEFRRHYDWKAYDAAIPTQNAVSDAQCWLLSNQGDYRSEPLHSLQDSAQEFIESGEGDPKLAIFEWSCPLGSDPEDIHALALANPNLGNRIEHSTLLGEAARVKRKGGKELAGFKIEVMCMRVPQTDPAIDAVAWRECAQGSSLDGLRDRVVLCFDVSLDEQHAALYASAKNPLGVIVVDFVKAWEGPSAPHQLAAQLPALVKKIKPVAVVWFPGGPAASVAAAMEKRKRRRDEPQWPPRGVEVEEVRGDAPAACMGFAALVNARKLSHGDDDLLNAHALSADKLPVGDAWRFTRIGAAHCNAVYAAAGAAHKARSVTPRRGFVVPSRRDSGKDDRPIEQEVP